MRERHPETHFRDKDPSMPSKHPKKPSRRWSQEMDLLYESEVHQKVRDHKSTTHTGNLNPLGYPHGIVQRDILEHGRADFTEGYSHPEFGSIDKFDKVLLYCYYNLRGHFHSSVDHFAKAKTLLKSELFSGDACVIDIGCGPATSALAIAEAFPGQSFQYFGIDMAQAMRSQGKTLLTAAKRMGILHKSTTFSFHKSWDLLPHLDCEKNILLNFSFFFASNSLDKASLRSLATKIKKIAMQIDSATILISYTNSIEPVANTNYDIFLDFLAVEPKEGRTNTSVSYRNRRSDATIKEQNYSRELYTLDFT